MSHGADDPAGHDQGLGGMVPPAGAQPEPETNDQRGRAAENEPAQGAAGEAQHGGRVGGASDDAAGDDNGVDPAV